MESIIVKIRSADWEMIISEMNQKGYAVIPGLISGDECLQLIDNYNNPDAYRKVVVMERYRFGLGEYKYFTYPLPRIVQTIRENIYPKLVPIANLWMKVLNIDQSFPETHRELSDLCISKTQDKPTPLILKYGPGGFNTLHQDLYGDIFFPIQTVLFLNEQGEDYTGGEFVLMQQIPRAQSKAIVLNLKKGDLLIFTTNFRPEKGSKGYYRVHMKHGVSEVQSGKRFTLGIIFHDAQS